MPRYYFEIGGREAAADDEGDLLADAGAARRMALAILTEVLPMRGDDARPFAVTVTVLDQDRCPIYRLETRAGPMDQPLAA